MLCHRGGSTCRINVGDRAVVREHNQFRGSTVEVTAVDSSRIIVNIQMPVWPGQPPVATDLEFEIAGDTPEIEARACVFSLRSALINNRHSI